MASEKKYSIAEKYIPHIRKILEDTGHSIDNIGGESAIFCNNVMKGIIDPSGNIQIDTTDEQILSAMTRYSENSKDYGE